MFPFAHVSRSKFIFYICALAQIIALTCSLIPASADTHVTPAIAPPFILADVDGKKHSLNEWKDRGGVFLFFCGCSYCQECSRLWADRQKHGLLPNDASGHALQTCIIFAGNAASARAFAASTGLDGKQTVLLPDPELHVTSNYHAAECPRAFVIDGSNFIRYTNNHSDDAPRKAPALVIVSNVIGAERVAASMPVSLAPRRSPGIEPHNPFALTVLPVNGIVSVKPSEGRYSFGRLDVLSKRILKQTFTLRNDTKKPILLARLGSSCGCTTAFVQRTTDKSTPAPEKFIGSTSAYGTAVTSHPQQPELQPGEKVSVNVSIDTSLLRSGPAKKLVWVFARGSGTPVATLELSGTVQSPVTFSPPVLNFGTVNADQSPSLPLTVTFDSRLLAANTVPPLVCANPDLQIIPEQTAPTHEEGQSKTAEQKKPTVSKMIQRKYRVQIAAKAALGLLNSTISYVSLPMPDMGIQKHPFTTLHTASRLGAPVVVIGEITGAVTIAPHFINFGAVPLGQDAVQDLTLTGSASALRACAVTSDNGAITAHVEQPASLTKTTDPMPVNTDKVALHVKVALNRQSLATTLSAHLTLTLADGTRISIPVSARTISPR